MSEIYRGSSQFLYLDLIDESADATPTVTAAVDSALPQALAVSLVSPAPTGVTQRYKVTVGLASTQSEGTLQVNWNLAIGGVPVTKTDYYEIVTPYLSISEVKSIFPQATDDEAVAVELSVRLIINAHCGQQFGFAQNKTVVVEGHGEQGLRLPQRLLKVTGIATLTAVLNPTNAIIVSDGWYLKKSWADPLLSDVTNDSTYWSGYEGDLAWHNAAPGQPGYEKPNHGPITRAPNVNTVASVWQGDYPFTIIGDWGYKSVPTSVKEAARLLVNDYACMEQMYRDRYLISMKAADWSLEFSSRAWESTGNVRADQLLDEFVLLDWASV